jgi:hypothetical protein
VLLLVGWVVCGRGRASEGDRRAGARGPVDGLDELDRVAALEPVHERTPTLLGGLDEVEELGAVRPAPKSPNPARHTPRRVE